ncbi:MAG TPA: PAS domain-containing sensor histidine kinase [Anaeromyxobacter sp.]|nr:PAS domain-containing sensor histidine kinase [Anaeromyxobacter sp.]
MDLSILESVPDALVIVDGVGAIVYLNSSAEQLFGAPLDELRGAPVESLLPERLRAMHRVHRAGYQTAPRRRPMGLGLDLAGLRRDGTEFPAEISLAPVELDGQPGTIVAVRDVTERRRVEEKARLWKRAQEELRERDEFLSIASHELRTPIAALQLQLQLLQRAARRAVEGPPRDLGQKLGLLERQTRRLTLLVNDLLDVSRLRLGWLALRREAVDLAEVAREVAVHAEAELSRAGSQLILDLAPTPAQLDRLRVEQVVANLLANAAKFGRGRPVTLRVRPEGESAVVVVADQGIGIAPEHQERVFERFQRAVSGQNFGGLGLGLYVARQIVEAHGGSIELRSVEGEGSTFTVRLPCHPEAALAGEPEVEAPLAEGDGGEAARWHAPS